jgi:hypothetical protein
MPCVIPISVPLPIRAIQFDELSLTVRGFLNGAAERVRVKVRKMPCVRKPRTLTNPMSAAFSLKH